MKKAEVVMTPFYIAPEHSPSDTYAAGAYNGFLTLAEAFDALPGLSEVFPDISWIVVEFTSDFPGTPPVRHPRVYQAGRRLHRRAR